MSSSHILENASVKRVREALRLRGVEGERVIALDGAARTAAEAAAALGCEVGAIVKSLVFSCLGEGGELQAVMALVAGDRQCNVEMLGRALGLGTTRGGRMPIWCGERPDLPSVAWRRWAMPSSCPSPSTAASRASRSCMPQPGIPMRYFR